MLPYSGDLVAGQASCMPQLRAYIEGFRDSLASQSPSREKDLEKFQKNLGFWNFRDSCWRLVREWKL